MKKIDVNLRGAILCLGLSLVSVCLFVSSVFSQGGTCGFATTQTAPVNSGVCVLCNVQNPANAVDTDTTNYSVVNAAVSGLGYFGQLLKFGNTYLAGDSVTVVLEIPSAVVSAQLLGGIGLQTYTGNTPTGSTLIATDPLLRLQLLGGGNKFRVTFAATNSFDGVGITLNGVVALLSSLRIYTARAFVAPPRIVLPLGIQATSQSSPLFSGVCVLCGVTNPALAVDRDTTTFSRITATVGALGYVGQLLKFPGSFHTGDSISLLLNLPVNLADAQVLAGIRVQTYSGNSATGTPRVINNLVRVDVLNTSGKIRVTFAATEDFDGVAVSINGTVTALTNLRIYDASVSSSAQSIIPICTGTSATLTAGTPLSATFNWYATATGGTSLATGTTFMTPPLTVATTYYVEASRNGCANPARTAVTVTPVAIPSAPVITPGSLSICPGDSVKAIVANPNGYLTRWYNAATAGTLLVTGDSLYIAGPAVTTTYYAASSNSGCAAPARTAFTVTVGNIPANITVTPASATINAGQTVTFTGSSADANTTGYVYNWYTQTNAGTPVYTGASFTTPALMSSTIYYLQVESATGCTNTTRIAVPVTVSSSGPGGGSNNVPCDAATVQSNTVNGICIGCSVTSPALAVDSDSTTYSTLHVIAGLLGGYVEQNVFFPFTGSAGDVVRIGIHSPSSLADISVLSALQFASYSGTTYNNDRTSTATLVTVNVLAGGQDAILSFIPQAAYDHIQIRLNSGVATLISQAGIRYVSATKPPATITPVAPSACAGNAVTLSATGNANTFFTWYDAPTGGNVLTTGSAFTTAPLTTTTTYYIATESITGCQRVNRTPVTVTVLPTPAAPVPAATTINTCAGNTVTASVLAPDPAITYKWYTTATSGTAIATGISFTSAALSTDTTFYLEAVNATGCAGSRTAINVITSPLPPAPDAASTSASVCAGTSAVLMVRNPSGAYSYQWYTAATGGTPAGTGVSFTTPVLSTTTTYYVTALTTQGCNSARTPVTVTVNPAPAAPTVTLTPSTPVTSGQSVSITVNAPVAGITYNFYTASTGGAPVATGTTYTTPGLQANTTYYVEAVSAQGCSSITRTDAAIVVNSTVSLDCDAPTTQTNLANGLCVGCTVTNPGNAVDADTATFSRLNMLVSVLTANISQTLVFPTASEAGDSLSILIGLPGILNPVTLGGALQLETLNGATSNGVISASDASVIAYPRAGNQYLLRFAPSATFDRVRLINNSGIVALFGTLDIYYATRKVGVPASATPPVALCSGTTTTLSAVSPANVTISWYTAPSGGTAVATGNTFTTPPVTANVVYYVEAGRTSNSCANTNRVPVQVIVNPAPAAPAVVSNAVTVCPGTSAALFVANASPQLTYSWYAAGTGGSALASGTAFNTPPVTSSATYYAEAVNNTGCGSSARTPVAVSLATSPAVPVISGNTGICSGSNAALTVTNPQAGVTYNFYNNAAGGSVLLSGITFTTPALATGRSYFVEAVGTQSCSAGASRLEIVVGVNSRPSAPVAVSENVSVCIGSPATLGIATPQSGTTYQWYDVPTAGTAVFTGASITTGAITTNTTLYAEANAAGCTSASRSAVNVLTIAVPSAPVLATGSTTATCAGGNTTLSIQNPVGGIAYDWYNAATGGTLLTTSDTYITPSLDSTAQFYVAARNSNGCTSTRTLATVAVTTFTGTAIVTASSPSVNAGSSATLSVQNPQAGYTYRFYNGAGTLLTTGTTYNTGALTATTTYYVEAVSAGGCVSPLRTPVTITVRSSPIPPGIGNNPSICAGNSASVSIMNPEGDITYNWYDQPTGGTLLFSAANITTPVLTQTTKYYVEANRNGSSSTRTEVTITVNPVPAAPSVTPVSVETCSTAPINLAVQSPLTDVTYNWYRVAVGGAPFTSGPTVMIPIPSNEVYYVDAVNSFGCPSLTRTALPVSILPKLAAPVVSFISKTDTSLKFGWDPIPGAVSYEYSIDGGITWKVSTTGTEKLEQVVGGLQPGVSVTIMVRSAGTVVCQLSNASNAVTGVTDNHLGDEVFIPNSFTPNGDGRNDKFRAYGNTLQTTEISIYTQWGNLIYHQANDINGWDGTAGGRAQPTGVYIYIIQVTLRNNTIITRKGSVNLIR